MAGPIPSPVLGLADDLRAMKSEVRRAAKLFFDVDIKADAEIERAEMDFTPTSYPKLTYREACAWGTGEDRLPIFDDRLMGATPEEFIEKSERLNKFWRKVTSATRSNG